MNNTSISVIIPAYNNRDFILQAVSSVLNQTIKASEIIVVDDGSSDNTSDLIKSKFKNQVILLKQKNQGISAARNLGIKKSTGEYIAFLDADDIWLEDKLEMQLQALKKHPEVSIVFTQAQNRLNNEMQFEESSNLAYPIVPGFIPSCCFLKREVIEKTGLFDQSVKLGEFAEWYGRAIDQGYKVYMVKKLLVLRRIHDHNHSLVNLSNQYKYLHILKEKIDRNRK